MPLEELSFALDEFSLAIEEFSLAVDEFPLALDEFSLTVEEFSLTLDEFSPAVEEFSPALDEFSLAVELLDEFPGVLTKTFPPVLTDVPLDVFAEPHPARNSGAIIADKTEMKRFLFIACSPYFWIFLIIFPNNATGKYRLSSMPDDRDKTGSSIPHNPKRQIHFARTNTSRNHAL